LIIDAHVHLWRLSRGDNAALSPAMTAIYSDREPADLKPLIDAAGVARVVVVQAAETLAETLFTVGLARKHAWIAGVVAWIELASPSVEEEVAALASIPAVKGVRPVRDDNRSIAWMLDSRLEPGFRALQDHGLSFDVLVQDWREIPLATLLAKHWPGLAIVLDHCGKPDVAGGVFDPWARHIDELASLAHVACKLSGLLNCARPGADSADVEVYVNRVLKAFGPSRVMWASDWPPLDLASDYATWKRISDVTLQSLTRSQRIDVMAGTASRIYRLDS
jgi:L-fuconolactonase